MGSIAGLHNTMANILLMALLTMLDAHGCISGIVMMSIDPDLNSNRSIAIPHIEIQLLDAANQQIVARTFTDKTGAFQFENVKPGGYFARSEYTGFKEHVAAISVNSGQETNIGKHILRARPLTEELFTVDKNGRSPEQERWEKDFARFDHIRHINTIMVMTVCEFMREQPALSTRRYDMPVIIIGTLVQTLQGNWLQQSCSEPLKSGDFVWPAAVSLNEVDTKQAIKLMLPNDDRLAIVTRPPDEEIDPKDRGRTWAAAYGRLDTRENLVAAPCGDDRKQCGYGFGSISAPAQLTIARPIRIFNEPTTK